MQVFTASNSEIIAGHLNESESKHCIRVLRKSKGDTILITNGNGDLHSALITEASPKKCFYTIQSTKHFTQITPPLHIAIAPTKNIDRFEFFLEKVTEIGVSQITPLLSFHSERKSIKQERLNRIITSACKQSKNFHFPKLNPLTEVNEIVKSKVKNKYVAHCSEGQKTHLKSLSFQEETLILIGPEGDFSEEEIQLALKNGFQPISLGESRLRTETAGIVACTIINMNYEH